MSSRIYADENDVRVEIAQRNEHFVLFYPQGGGFQRKAPVTEFDARFKPVKEELPFKEVAIQADWLPEGFQIKALSDGNVWNGWAQPFFRLEEALRLSEVMDNVTFDAANDRFVIRNEDYEPPEDVEFVDAVTLKVAGESIKTYPIGAGSWCWETAREQGWQSVGTFDTCFH